MSQIEMKTPSGGSATIKPLDRATNEEFNLPLEGGTLLTKEKMGEILHPSITGSITLNGTTNNTVILSGIVNALSLEVGDVIRIDTGAYNKLHTVESITNNNSIIVNYEHAGNRSNGSLKLPNCTGPATVTRIAKWFNASIGLGQAPLSVKSLRTIGAAYTNDTGRAIFVYASLGNTSGEGYLSVDGVKVSYNYEHNVVNGVIVTSMSTIVPRGSNYAVNKAEYYIDWVEVR